MYGYNFEVTLGIEYFENCFSYDDLKSKLKYTFPNSKPDLVAVIEIDQNRFWEEINLCLNYRGDKSAGYFLGPENQEQILKEQNQYINFLKDFITEKSSIFIYPDEQGIPGYPVWWDFRFILFQVAGQCIFTYGSASD
jgi:hypothetical protein